MRTTNTACRWNRFCLTESAGVGIVSLHLQNKSGRWGDAVRRDRAAARVSKPARSGLEQSVRMLRRRMGSNFSVMYGEYGFCGSRFIWIRAVRPKTITIWKALSFPAATTRRVRPCALLCRNRAGSRWFQRCKHRPWSRWRCLCRNSSGCPATRARDRAVTLSQIGLRITSQQTGI